MKWIVKVSLALTGVLAVAGLFALLSFYSMETGHSDWAQIYLNTSYGIVGLFLLFSFGAIFLRKVKIKNGKVSF